RENVVFLGVDWRHVGDLERIFRATFDFIETNGGTVIPVELTAFDAKARNRNVDLTWSTASETNSSHFEIERADAVTAGAPEFETVARVSASGKSSTARNYSATDMNLAPGKYAYRLRMVDLDGSSRLSGERQVTVASQTEALALSTLSPNPASTFSQFEISGMGHATVEVYDASGALVLTAFDGELNGSAKTVRVDASRLASGSYTVVVKNGDNAETRNLTIVR
ncbi:MAG: T9SS type A sorting domain-containing protein, partial [Chloroflexota bacterium]